MFCLWTALETCLYFLFKSTSLPLSPGDASGALCSHQNTPAPLLPCDSSTHTCRWAAGPTLGTSLLQARPPPASITLPGLVHSLILLNTHCAWLNVLYALPFSILTNPSEAGVFSFVEPHCPLLSSNNDHHYHMISFIFKNFFKEGVITSILQIRKLRFRVIKACAKNPKTHKAQK